MDGAEDLTALVQARLAPLRVITAARLLNGWYPPGPWHRLTARICGSCEPAGLGRAWARVDADTRWEGVA